jgi:Fe-S cluster biogenesis protein NfuA
MKLPGVNNSNGNNLTDSYRIQIEDAMKIEAAKRLHQMHEPQELTRLQNLSLLNLHYDSDDDLIPALMARLGPVRAALDGHGGGLIVENSLNNGEKSLSLILNLDGACISCGAAPGTLQGIQDDLLIDPEIISIRFSKSMLEWFDELQKEFLLKHGGVTFV